MEQDITTSNATSFNFLHEASFSHPDLTHPVVNPAFAKLNGNENLKSVLDDLKIGKNIHKVLKEQGCTVTWLAQQLGMERTSLYYTFRQNSIDAELLLRISFYLNHNFLQDAADVYKTHGLHSLNL